MPTPESAAFRAKKPAVPPTFDGVDYDDPAALKAAQDAIIREQWVKCMMARVVRDELGLCYRREGLNHLANCSALRGELSLRIVVVGVFPIPGIDRGANCIADSRRAVGGRAISGAAQAHQDPGLHLRADAPAGCCGGACQTLINYTGAACGGALYNMTLELVHTSSTYASAFWVIRIAL